MKRNKQADLLRKLELAKKQNEKQDDAKTQSAEEIQKENDRKRFEYLLNSESATVSHMNEYEGSSYLTKEQEEEEAEAAFMGENRFYEGDEAAAAPFQDLVSVKSEKALGPKGAERLLPWLRDKSDYVIVLSEPRTKSTEFRKMLMNVQGSIPFEILDRIVVINADSPSENRKWMKKNGITTYDVFSDEKREWMRAYTALGKKRWSITMFILSEGRIQKLVRDMDFEMAPTIISNAVKSLRES